MHPAGNVVAGSEAEQPYLVVSTDSHAGPSLERQLRQYCPQRYLAEFDDFVTSVRHGATDEASALIQRRKEQFTRSGLAEDALRRARECPGLQDPDARRRDMDADGIAADVIFAGGLNNEPLPFIGFGADAGPAAVSPELRGVGARIWNAWLADFVSVDPWRHVGVMQIPIYDVGLAVSEVEWGKTAGLGAVNLPAPRSDFPSYTDPIYEPLWSACEELDLPMVTHGGAGEPPVGIDAPAGDLLFSAENHLLSRRGLWHLILGGVFERHAGLRFVLCEQRSHWVPETLRDLDSIWVSRARDYSPPILPRLPSEYWHDHCYVGASFMARFEFETRDEVGLDNLLWGTDYPHPEGTWPHTELALRRTFSEAPVDAVRRVLGQNAVDVFGLDEQKLRAVADQIGPTPRTVSAPLPDSELPDYLGQAFRTVGAYA